MNYTPAKTIADRLVLNMRPFCERIEIAGSLRRMKADPSDIEIVAIPRVTIQRDIFYMVVETRSHLDDFHWSAYGTVLKNGSRYKQIALRDGINLDLFVVMPPADWGVIFTIRTGPAELSRKIVTQKSAGGYLPSDCRVMDGHVVRGLTGLGETVPMPEEIDFLDFCGVGWIEPSERGKLWGNNK